MRADESLSPYNSLSAAVDALENHQSGEELMREIDRKKTLEYAKRTRWDECKKMGLIEAPKVRRSDNGSVIKRLRDGIRWHQEGASVSTIAKRQGMDRSSVYANFKRYGYDPKSKTLSADSAIRL